MNESEFKQKLRRHLSAYGMWQTIETTTGNGVPDIAFICRHGTVWIEAKVRHGGEVLLRPAQLVWFRQASEYTDFLYTISEDDDGFIRIFNMTKIFEDIPPVTWVEEADKHVRVYGSQRYFKLPQTLGYRIPYHELGKWCGNLK